MKRITNNNHGSMNPVIIFIICLAIVSFLVLILGFILEPFMNLMDSSDTNINPDISVPRGYVSTFVQIIWPKGLLLITFLILSGTLLMEYQKNKYQQG